MVFKLVRKTTFEQTYNFFVIICFVAVVVVVVGYNQSLRQESNFILFCAFNCVTYINPHPLNPFISKFRSSRRKPSYQYYLIYN